MFQFTCISHLHNRSLQTPSVWIVCFFFFFCHEKKNVFFLFLFNLHHELRTKWCNMQVRCTLARAVRTLSECALRVAPCRRGMKLTCCRNPGVEGAGQHDTDKSFMVLLRLPSRRGESHFTSISPTHLNPWDKYVNVWSRSCSVAAAVIRRDLFPGSRITPMQNERHIYLISTSFFLVTRTCHYCTYGHFIKSYLFIIICYYYLFFCIDASEFPPL